jgi:hypothetical protein
MAAYFSLVITALLYYAFKINDIKERVFVLAAAGTGFFTLLLTHNRSGILGIILALFLYLVNDPSINLGKKVKTFIYASCAFVILVIVVSIYFPETVEVYIIKLATYLPDVGLTNDIKTAENYVEGDYSRIYFFKTVIASLGSNPIGNGFSKIYSEAYGVSSPHNVFSWLIWAAGLMAFIWIPVFALQVKKHFGLKSLRVRGGVCDTSLAYISALQVGLFAWILDNLAHASLNTGLGWMFLGLVLNLIHKCKTELQSGYVEQMDMECIPVDNRILRRKR